MKKISKVILFIALGIGSLFAQNGNNVKSPEQAALKRIAKWSTDLSLTDAQKTQLKPILTTQIAEHQALLEKYKDNRQAGRDEFKAQRLQHQEQLKQVLTASQLTKLEQDRIDKMKANRARAGNNGNQLPPPEGDIDKE